MPAPPAIADWDRADDVLLGVAECRGALARIESELASEIDAAKAAAKRKASEYSARFAAGLAALEAFTRAHQGDLDGRSKKLTHGRVGLRQVTKIALLHKAEFVIQRLRAKDMIDCIRRTEAVKKEALAAYDDAALAAVGAKRKTADVFFADTDEVTL